MFTTYSMTDLTVGLVLYVFITVYSHYAELRHNGIEKLLLRQLYYDTPSGQPNRKMLIEDISHKIFPAVFILRINNYHDINIFFGHSLGDDLKKFIGERLNMFSASRKMKSYNLSGGEFALVLDLDTSSPDITNLELIASDLIHHIAAEEFTHQNANIPLTAYAGISFYTNEGSNIISQAEIALHHAIIKNAPYHTYNAEDSDRKNFLENINTLSELKTAITQNRIVPYYQGIMNNKSGIK